jgi:hypothetical protein
MALPIYFLLRDTQEDVKEITLQELNHRHIFNCQFRNF